jgi:hypothetical protein
LSDDEFTEFDLPELQERVTTLVREATATAQTIRDMFKNTPQDYMRMLLTFHALFATYPGLHKFPEATRLITEWIIAGEPEVLSDVPARMLERLGPEKYRKYEEHIAKQRRTN